MQTAGEEEAALATQAGDLDDDGIPVIAVVTDGAWRRRSYGTNYNALSGVLYFISTVSVLLFTACTIGTKIKMFLFTSTRNSYCCIYDRASSKGESINSHVCYKNYKKSSTAMDADIIVERFRNIIGMHNLKYNKLIGKY
ncbi:hypothetical protein PR048_023466 [Dryococelus australis]|uniref:Mutator-like transposase domain-containing protein n=1 Tax=Dryococelus australis TaxID=614101 RepID=A0ABQ9GU62_9NEOP|nr:hypothetical protein PR048_023466 [Dryococelus australis]